MIDKLREEHLESSECLFKIIKDNWDPERSKREDVFLFRPEKYEGPIAIDRKPSKECDEYHKRFQIQVNIKNDAVL